MVNTPKDGSMVPTEYAICAVDECATEAATRGWCRKHYTRWIRTGDPLGLRYVPMKGTACIVEGCEREGYAFDLCSLHYKRKKRTGGTVKAGGIPIEERFWRYVDADGPCWLWTGTRIGRTGYGHISLNGQTTLAHRWAWEFLIGPIPKGMQLDHLCRVKCCVNPDHLEVVTPSENTRRWWAARYS
jgi:HNH endonuclease